MRPALPSGRTNPRWTARQKLQSNAAQLKKFNFRQTGKPRLASSAVKPPPIKPRREDHYTPEKFRMECVWENLLRR